MAEHSARRPLIGVTAGTAAMMYGAWSGHEAVVLTEHYVAAVRAAGARPVILAPQEEWSDEEIAELDGIVLSHLHGDHFGGIPFLLLDAHYDQARDRPLTIVGPPGTAGRLLEALEVFFPGSSRIAWRFPLEIVDLPCGGTTRLGDVAVDWPLDHDRFRVFVHADRIGLYFPLDGSGLSRVMATDLHARPDEHPAPELTLAELQSAFAEAACLPVTLSRPGDDGTSPCRCTGRIGRSGHVYC